MSLKLAMKDGNRLVGVAYADASVREIGVSEFGDNDLFSNVEVSTVLNRLR